MHACIYVYVYIYAHIHFLDNVLARKAIIVPFSVQDSTPAYSYTYVHTYIHTLADNSFARRAIIVARRAMIVARRAMIVARRAMIVARRATIVRFSVRDFKPASPLYIRTHKYTQV
jgi:hypothetical protein